MATSRRAAPRRLSASGVRARLARLDVRAGDAAWRVARGAIAKRFVFDDFRQAFAFMRRVAKVADAMDHHPDWSNSYKTVNVRLSTHSAKGVTALDLRLAQAMDRLQGKRARPRGKRPAEG